jgi:outer membrane protein TolC
LTLNVQRFVERTLMQTRLSRLTVVAAALLALAGAAPAHAERALTLDEALAIARRNNYDLRQAKERLAQSAVGIEQAWAPLLPTVGVQAKYTRNWREVTIDFSSVADQVAPALTGLATATIASGVQNAAPLNSYIDQVNAMMGAQSNPIVIQKANQLDFAASATVPLVVPYAYEGLKAAKRNYASAEATFKVTEASILVGTAQAFFAAAGAEELVGARTHGIEVAQKTLDNARARLEAGVVNRVEVMRAELALVRAQQALREANDIRAQAYRSLTTLIQLKEPFKVVPPGRVDVRPQAIDELAREALQLRPEYAAYQRGIEAAHAQKNAAAWRWAPSLSAFGLLRFFNYPGFAGDNYAWNVGLQLDWAIYEGGLRDAARHQAAAIERENRLRLEQARDVLTDELYNARRAVETRQAALVTAERSVELSRSTLDLVRVQYEAGTATQLDLLQAQDALISTEVALAQARFDLLLADLTLRRSAGLFPMYNNR